MGKLYHADAHHQRTGHSLHDMLLPEWKLHDYVQSVGMKYLFILLFLCGCSTIGLTDIVQEDLSRERLYDVCEPMKHVSFTLYGCKRTAFNRCYIYVLAKAEHPSEEEYIDTVEHELRHCADGKFH